MKRRTVDVVRVYSSPTGRTRGLLRVGGVDLPCALGRSGLVVSKREGDGGTPVSAMRIIGGYYRSDQLRRPPSLVRLRPIRPDDGWCDDRASRRYNQPIRLPSPASHEGMWRADNLYDLVFDLGWNRHPVIKGRGSAIFLHGARPGLRPTEGCIALPRRTLVRLAARLGPRTTIEVVGAGRFPVRKRPSRGSR